MSGQAVSRPSGQARRSLARRAGATTFVVVAAVACTIAATGGQPLSGAPQDGRRTGGARRAATVAERHGPFAASASGHALRPPPGATRVAVVDAVTLYVWRNADDEDCMIDLRAKEVGVATCAPAATVRSEGTVQVFLEGRDARTPGSPPTLRISALVPPGVQSVRITDRNARSYLTHVKRDANLPGGVVMREDPDAATVSYVLPNGATRVTNVTAIVDRTPRAPVSPKPGATR